MDPRLVLTVLCSAAELFAFYRFVRARVHRILPWFSAYLVVGFAQSFVWLVGPPGSHAYTNAYGLTTPLVIGLQIGVFLEVWRKLFMRSSRTDRAAKALGLAIIGASIALGLLSGVDGLALHMGLSRRLFFQWISWIIRYSATVLCIASSLLAVWASTFESRLPRFLQRHAYLLACYFGSIAAGYLMMNLDLLPARLAGELTVGSAAGLYLLWGILTTDLDHPASEEPRKDGQPEDPISWSDKSRRPATCAAGSSV